jgi:hypothetical protein
MLNDVGLSLLALVFLLSVPGVRRLSVLGRLILAGLGLALLWAPIINGQTPLFYASGLITGISVPTQVLMALGVAHRLGWRNPLSQPLPRDIGALLAGIFVLLFLSTLGYIQYDLYGWGYQPRVMLAAVWVLLAWSWRRHPGLAIAWLAGLTAFAFHLSPSINLWDAVGDPILMLGGLWRLAISERLSTSTVCSRRLQPALRLRRLKPAATI